ncbi:MAG: DUF1624 domain-containing protein [Bacteroidales bacterium]|nr:DUF1624 domain-containing protein [Bacteroidales bacterium]
MTESLQNKRLATPDLLKGIAILFMIQVHLMELFARPVIYGSWLGKISLFLGGTPAAPIFMMIMGYFVAKANLSSMKLIRRGVQLIIWGILLNIALNFHILIRIIYDHWNFDLWQFIFGVDILPLAGLSLIFIALLPKVVKEKWYLLLLIIIVIFGFGTLINGENISSPWNYLSSFIIGGTTWSYFPVLPWLAYVLSGYAFLKLEGFFLTWSWHQYYKIFLIVGFIIFLSLSWNYASSITHNLEDYYHHGIDFYIWSVVFSLFWAGFIFLYAQDLSNTLFGKYLIFTGKNITSIYVFQWLIIGNMATTWYKQQDWMVIIVSFIFIIIVSSALSWTWNYLKHKI